MAEATYTKVYKDFRGVDFSSERSECDSRRFKDLVNMWKDYRSESGAAVETAPGFRTLLEGSEWSEESDSKVNGLHFIPTADENDVGKLIVHHGTGLSVCTMKKNVKGDDGKTVKGISVSEDSSFTVANKRSQSVLFYDRLFVVDGQKYFCLYEEDSEIKHSFCSDQAYVPTTFIDGEPYEQRNMLTDEFVEKWNLASVVALDQIRPAEQCIKISFVKTEKGTLYPFWAGNNPSGNHAYQDEGGNQITFENNVYGYCDWKTIHENGSTDKIPITVHLGKVYGESNAGKREFLRYFFYAKYTNGSSATYYYLYTSSNDHTELLAFNYSVVDETDLAKGITIDYIRLGNGYSGIIEIHGVANPRRFTKVENFRDVLTGNPDFSDGFTGTAKEAINGCTLITEFDGRVFLSGNPNLPNTVFYSQRDLTGYNNPFYIGCYNYLNDGTGRTPITAMMTTPTQLIVLKDHVAQGASIYYHYGADNPAESKVTRDLQPRIYPRENGVPGVGCLGLACNFLDDPVFLSPNGLEAIGKSQVNLERTLAHRSSYVDARLLNENLRGAVAAEWEGYLALLVPGGKLYLADGRQRYEHSLGGYQYEWYYWDGIGVYAEQYFYLTGPPKGITFPEKIDGYSIKFQQDNLGLDKDSVKTTVDNIKYVIIDSFAYPVDAKTRYYYLTQAPEGVEVPEEIDGLVPAYKTIRDYVDDDIMPDEVKLTYNDPEEGTIEITGHYVVEADATGSNVAYLVDTDGEKPGVGDFQEATALLAVDGCLLFGCKDGSVCVFNTDRRGEDHYIPPEDYTRCGRRYTARCVTISDTCGRTNLAKSTIRNSLVLKTKAFPYAKVDVKVRTDVDSWEPCDTVYAGVADFGYMDFGALSFNPYDESVAVVRERKKRWLEKQLSFEAECYESPFGIISATFDFKVAGKVKMR